MVCPKRKMERYWETFFDALIGKTVTQAKQVPVRISYTVGGKRVDKVPDAEDLRLIQTIDSKGTDKTLNPKKIPAGDKTGEPIRIGLDICAPPIHHKKLQCVSQF